MSQRCNNPSALQAVLVAEQPMSARSLLASMLLGTRPPRLPVRGLVRAGALFGIAEGTVRTALSRMAANGEVEAEDGSYRLRGHLLERQTRQEASRAALRQPWDGTWELAVVEAERRPAAERAELRHAAIALRLGELREGVWTRPANLDAGRAPSMRAVVSAQCLAFAGGTVEDPAAVASRLWELGSWAERARQLEAAFDELAATIAAGDLDALAPGFVLAAAGLRHFQADPLLPEELLPASWPGAELRVAYDRYEAAFQRALREYLRGEA